MIKYHIYGVFQKQIEWYITTNIYIDSGYWYEKGCQYLLYIDKPYIISDSVLLLECLNKIFFGSGHVFNKDYILNKIWKCNNDITNKNLILIDTRPTFESYLEKYLIAKKDFLQYLAGKLLLFEEVNTYVKQTYNNLKNDELLAIVQVGYLISDIEILAGVQQASKHKNIKCNRCGSSEHFFTEQLFNGKDSCEVCADCIELNKSSSCTPLFHFVAAQLERERDAISNINSKGVILTSYQEQVSNKLIEYLKKNQKKEIMVWAVTGSGKTEMVFQAIEDALSSGKRVLFASPRKDVIKELAPRFVKAFPTIPIVSLYGGSSEKWNQGLLYLSTTHQILRFQSFFELIIVDEIDAFPYKDNKMLNDAVSRALKTDGQMIYLTATPSSDWLEKMNSSKIHYLILPIRYHEHLLPEPHFEMSQSKEVLLKSTKPVPSITKFMNHVKDVNGQAFIFVPEVRDIGVWASTLKRWFPDNEIDGVYANDKLRDVKITKFKAKKLQFLVTTTIMERGVTVSNLHILVINAESLVFDASTLIQISGRVGRNGDYPKGTALFLGEYNTKAIKKARKQIKDMNKLAQKLSKGKITIDELSD